MSDPNRMKRYKYKNIAAGLAVLLLALVALSTSCSPKTDKASNTSADSDTVDTTADEVAEENASGDQRLTKNYKYVELQNGTSVNNGWLVQVDAAHPFTGQINDPEALYSFMFDASGEQILYAGYPSDEAAPEMLKNLNLMAADFVKETKLNTLMVSSMVPEDSTDKTDEAFIGTCVDMMLYDPYSGSFGEFTVEDKYAWLPENCYKYGFVMRGQNRFRYIGKEAAACLKFMNSGDGQADLEKLWTDIKSYSFESPMFFALDSGTEYVGYYVPIQQGSITTSIPIPTRDNGSEYTHTVSGNNTDGFIVFVDISENAAFDSYYEQSSESKAPDVGTLPDNSAAADNTDNALV